LAKAKPASALKKTTATVTTDETMAEFTSAFAKSTVTRSELNSRPMLWKRFGPGRSLGG
jgi:hypothetical protein